MNPTNSKNAQMSAKDAPVARSDAERLDWLSKFFQSESASEPNWLQVDAYWAWSHVDGGRTLREAIDWEIAREA